MGDIQGADRADVHREGLVRGRMVKGPWSGQGVAFGVSCSLSADLVK